MNEDEARAIATMILDRFEELLKEWSVHIPSDDREGLFDEPRLCGSEYGTAQARVVQVLMDKVNGGSEGVCPSPTASAGEVGAWRMKQTCRQCGKLEKPEELIGGLCALCDKIVGDAQAEMAVLSIQGDR